MILVVDACVAIKWYVEEAGFEDAIRVLESSDTLIAPDYLLIEFASVVSKKLRSGEVGQDQAREMLQDLSQTVAHIEPSGLFLPDAFALSLDLSHPIYDCIYLAMAKAVAGKVLTADAKFSEKASAAGFGEFVLDLADYRASTQPLIEDFPDWSSAVWLPDLVRLTVQVNNIMAGFPSGLVGGKLGSAAFKNELVWTSPAAHGLRALVEDLTEIEKVYLVTTCLLPINGTLGSSFLNAKRILADSRIDLAQYLARYMNWFERGRELVRTRLQSEHKS